MKIRAACLQRDLILNRRFPWDVHDDLKKIRVLLF